MAGFGIDHEQTEAHCCERERGVEAFQDDRDPDPDPEVSEAGHGLAGSAYVRFTYAWDSFQE